MALPGSDPLLRRIERRAIAVCAVAIGIAVAFRPRQLDLALGILGGGLLAAVSYWAIRSGVDGLIAAPVVERADVPDATENTNESAARRRSRRVGFVVRFVGRYALLALLAYAMIARFGLHPVGVLIGASSVVVAVSLEAVASLPGRRDGRRQDPPDTSRNLPGN